MRREQTARPMRDPIVLLATGFGFGLSPFAPGTVGALWGIPLVLALKALPGTIWEALAAVSLCLLAVPVCNRAERFFQKKDDHRIVADEYATFPLCMIGLPLTWWVVALAFVTHRLCDILKPPPAGVAQRLPGGWGVVMDDVLASLYSLAINHLVVWVVRTYVL